MAQENGRETRFSLREAILWTLNHFKLDSENMTQFRRKIITKSNIRRKIQQRLSVVRPHFHRLLRRFPFCSERNKYRMLSLPSLAGTPFLPYANGDIDELVETAPPPLFAAPDSESDLVDLKISLLGDCQIGKTSFLVKYAGSENEEKMKESGGLSNMDKTLAVAGARISYCLWEVAGDENSKVQIPLACKDSVAILIMFDLSCRRTLNSVLGWYIEVRKWNPRAIPVLVGTKFDEFAELPLNLQTTITDEAREYAKAFNAALFFSSAKYSINVNKIFKFITAKLFDLPWTVQRNLKLGEPIIDY